MQIYRNKRKRLHKKRVQLPQDWFGTPTWPPFYCFGTPIWPPWRHVKTLYSAAYYSDNNWDTFYPLYLPQLSFSFKKYVQCPYVGYWMWFFIDSDFLNMRSWKNFILQLSSALASNTSNQKLKSRRPFRSFAGFHCQAIENKSQDRLIDKLQKLGNQKGSKYTLYFSIGRYIFRLSSFIPYDPKLLTYMYEQFLFYKISNLQKREKDVRYCTA